MLTNKKISIRVFALVLALLMAVAVFAGCSSDAPAQDDQARADADKAQQAANEAKNSVDSLAKDLAEKLDALNGAIAGVGDKVDKNDKELQDQIDKWHSGETTADPDAMTKPGQNEVTDKVSEKVLAKFTELKNKFLITRADWYTVENYTKLSEIFETASFELYRVTTEEGVEALIADTETKANAVPNIVSEGNAVQALIAKFGDVPTQLFTTNESMVIAARTAFDKWVNDYAIRFFEKNGFTFTKTAKGVIDIAGTGERKIVDFARKTTGNLIYININENTNSLLYAEAKLAALYAYAEDAAKSQMVAELMISGGMSQSEAEAIVNVLFDENATNVDLNKAINDYKVVKAIIAKNGVTYKECKANANIIENCYEVYRTFWNANGGDDTPIKDAHGLLTGTQFVQLFVICLYDNALADYQNQIFNYYVNEIVPFFLNSKDATAHVSDVNVQAPAWIEYLGHLLGTVTGYDSNDYYHVLGMMGSKATFSVEEFAIDVYYNGAKQVSIPANGITIERNLKAIVAVADEKVLQKDYSADFKGKKSLEQAFTEIDQNVAKSLIDMFQVYYNNIIVPYLNYISNEYVDIITNAYANTNGNAPAGYNYTNKANVNPVSAYYNSDNEFYLQAKAIIEAANKKWTSVTFKTYDELNSVDSNATSTKNISNRKVFNAIFDANGAFDHIELNTTNSAFETVLQAAFKTLDAAVAEYLDTVYYVDEAAGIHDLAIDYAIEIDELAGIAVKADATDAAWIWTVESTLINDYGAAYKSVVGSKNYSLKSVYGKLVAARDAAVKDILSVKLLNNDGSLAIDKETYAAVDAKGKAWYHANTATFGTMTTDSKDNVAVQVVVDPEIVAEYIMIEKFAKGADAVVLAFCDATRAEIKATLSSDLEFYGTKYFGDLDHVKLEADMKAYIEYLNGLTEFAGIGSAFKTASFSLKNQALDKNATGIDDIIHKYDSETKINSYVLHIYDMDRDTDDITGLVSSTYEDAWYNKTKGKLDTYFNIKNGTVVSDGLFLVKQLSYKKDYLKDGDSAVNVELNGNTYSPISIVYAKYTGTVKDGKFTVAPAIGYEYVLGTQRTALYLSELAKVKAAITEKVVAVNLLDCGVKDGADPADAYAAAIDALEAIMLQAENGISDGLKADKSLDDYSFPIAWSRYYDDNPATAYDWTNYKG